jgi:immunity protein, SdpI family
MKKITIFSLACILLAFGLAVFTWVNLPNIQQYPVHWNASGVPDRYGSKFEVLFALLVMPFSMVLVYAIFTFIPKLEPVKTSIDANRRPYTYLWVLIMLLLAGLSGFVSYSYTNIGDSPDIAKSSISFLVIALSAFFIFMGNIMGKFKRNFLIGIRTPWTLSSDLAWDKTHRLGGRMFVGVGFISLVGTFLMRPETALYIFVGLSLAIAIFTLVYSFLVWKNDPNKRI